MLRAVIVFLVLVAAAMAAAWLADHPGVIAVTWGGYEIIVPTAVAALALAIALAVALVLYKVWYFFSHSPSAISGWRREGRRKRGYQALSRGLVAVAAGDAGEARKLAKQTTELLDDRRLTLLLSAQAAQLDGDEAAARRFFEAMRDEPDTEFLGLRGLLVQARRAGRDAEALALARRAHELRPSTPWVLQELFALESQATDYQAAQKVLDQSGKQGLLEQQDLRRRRGVVRLAAAQAADDRGESSLAIAEARKALDQIPGFTPAAALAARLHIAAGDIRKARKLLEQAWSIEPHRELAKIYLTLDAKANETARLQTLKRFASTKADHPESRIAIARAAMDIGDREEARAQLEPLVQEGADGDVCRLMAELADHAGDTATAATWLRRAAAAPGSAGWQCGSCGHQCTDWALHCPSCGAFDTLGWRRAGAAPVASLLTEEPGEDPPAGDEIPVEAIENPQLSDSAQSAARP